MNVRTGSSFWLNCINVSETSCTGSRRNGLGLIYSWPELMNPELTLWWSHTSHSQWSPCDIRIMIPSADIDSIVVVWPCAALLCNTSRHISRVTLTPHSHLTSPWQHFPVALGLAAAGLQHLVHGCWGMWAAGPGITQWPTAHLLRLCICNVTVRAPGAVFSYFMDRLFTCPNN